MTDEATPEADRPAVRQPAKAAFWGLRRLAGNGEWETCRWHEGGRAADRWPVSIVPTQARIGQTWGRASYKVLWWDAGGISAGVSRLFQLDDPSLPVGGSYPNAPPAPPAPALAPSAKPEPPNDLVRMLTSALGGGDASQMTLVLLQMVMGESSARAERAERMARLEIEAERLRAQARIEEERQRAHARVAETAAFYQSVSRALSDARRPAGEDDLAGELAALRAEVAGLRTEEREEDPLRELLRQAGPDLLRRLSAALPGGPPNGKP